MRYVALISKRSDSSSRYFTRSAYAETKERFVERITKCYIKPYDIPYWDVEIFELGEEVAI